MPNSDCDCENCNPSLETYVYSANKYFKEGNLGCAYFHFMNAIEKYNDRDSYICVGIMHEKGWHVPKDYTEAMKYYTFAANQGAQDAQYCLGLIYFRGTLGVSRDYGKAFSWFQKASETTDFVPKLTWLDGAIPEDEMYTRGKAQRLLSILYSVGIGVTSNQNMSLHWLTKAAENENSIAQYELARHYYRKEDLPGSRKLSLKWIQKAACNKYNEAQYIMGVYKYFGRYFPKNENDARYWFNRAIENNGHPEALKCLTLMDRNRRMKIGNSLFFKHLKQSLASTSDDEESDDESYSDISIYEPSDLENEEEGSQQYFTQNSLQELKDQAEDGNLKAQNKLGEELLNNHGDKRHSVYWFSECASEGSIRGIYNLGNCYHKGIGFKMDQRKAFERFKRSAGKGEIDAQFMVGEYYRYGYGGLSIDYSRAKYWYLKAAKPGHVKAQYEIGNLYLLENYKDKNVSKAFSWFLKSAKQGNSDARYKVGICYLEGFGVQKDYYKARTEFLLAIKNGNTDALLSIGMMYQQGLGIPRDYKQALKYYEAAAEKDYDKAFLSINNLKDIMRKEQSDSQKSVFKSGTEQFFHVGELINALPDTDKIGASSSDKVRIIEERESAVFLHVEDHGVKVTEDRRYATNAIFNNDRGSTVYRKEEESAKFLHVDDTSIKIAEAKKQSAVFMHVEDTSSNVSEKNGQSPHFFHVENAEIRRNQKKQLDDILTALKIAYIINM